eukprot:1395886-Pyramimonas_sp.AAC.1
MRSCHLGGQLRNCRHVCKLLGGTAEQHPTSTQTGPRARWGAANCATDATLMRSQEAQQNGVLPAPRRDPALPGGGCQMRKCRQFRELLRGPAERLLRAPRRDPTLVGGPPTAQLSQLA